MWIEERKRDRSKGLDGVARRTAIAVAAASVLCASTAGVASAAGEKWPTEPITIIVPFSPGGSVDRMARGMSSFLPEYLGAPVYVRNKPGAGGQLGHTYFLQQPPDCTTLAVTPATPYIANNILMTGADFSMDDFAFINAQWADWTMIAVPKDRPWKTLGELIDAIKADPGKISTGVTFGSAGHLSTLVLLDALGLDENALRIVTYTGGGPLRTALAGGQIDFSVVQAEGSEVVRDMVRPLAAFLPEHNKEWDVPPINQELKPYKTSVPLINGSIRTLAASAACRKEHPDRFQTLVDATRNMLESKAAQRYFTKSHIGADWRGPEQTTEILNQNFEILKRYQGLIKK